MGIEEDDELSEETDDDISEADDNNSWYHTSPEGHPPLLPVSISDLSNPLVPLASSVNYFTFV